MSVAADPASGVQTVALDTNMSPVSRGLYVGVPGDIAVVASDGSSATFTNVPGGTVLPVRVRRVNSSGTTASGLVALY
jgi:hypothetical protein